MRPTRILNRDGIDAVVDADMAAKVVAITMACILFCWSRAPDRMTEAVAASPKRSSSEKPLSKRQLREKPHSERMLFNRPLSATVASTDGGQGSRTNGSTTEDFNVNKIRPFSRSTIQYRYTEPSAIGIRTPEQVWESSTDQAYSVSVVPFDCTTDKSGPQKKKRRRWKTMSTANDVDVADLGTASERTRPAANSAWPLPPFPVDSTDPVDRRQASEVPAEQLDELYTVAVKEPSTASAGTTISATDGTGHTIIL